MNFKELLASEFRRFRELSEEQLQALEQHYTLLLSWNRRLNLTRITELGDAVCLHYAESLFLGTVLPQGSFAVGDLGSGAGFPGIPIAILRPELQVTLIESDRRKAVFLREATRRLGNVVVFCGRFEDYPARFEWAVCRAVDPIEVLGCRISPNSAVLMSSGRVLESAEVIKSPWGKDRLIRVSRDTVSRETFGW